MASAQHHWMTVHRVKFDHQIAASDRAFEAPGRAECWRFCPSQSLNEAGLPNWKSDVWGGMGLYETREDAEAMLHDLSANVPWMSEATESWHALLVPIAHHGAVNWRGSVENDSAIRISRQTHEGRMAVVTTAGFDTRDAPRIKRFLQGVGEITDYYGTLRGNLLRDVFNGGFDGRDGFTFTVWDDDKAMIAAAYRDGTHKTWMDESKDVSLFDRSSFTRARLIESSGTWDGRVPI